MRDQVSWWRSQDQKQASWPHSLRNACRTLGGAGLVIIFLLCVPPLNIPYETATSYLSYRQRQNTSFPPSPWWGHHKQYYTKQNTGSKEQPQQAMPVCGGNRIGHGSTSPTVAVALCLFWCHQAGKLWRFPQHLWSQQPKWGQRHQSQHTHLKSSTPYSRFIYLSVDEWT